MIAGRSAKNVDLLVQNVVVVQINVGITARKAFVFRKVNSLVPGATRRVQKNTQYQQTKPLDWDSFSVSVQRQLVRENP